MTEMTERLCMVQRNFPFFPFFPCDKKTDDDNNGPTEMTEMTEMTERLCIVQSKTFRSFLSFRGTKKTD